MTFRTFLNRNSIPRSALPLLALTSLSSAGIPVTLNPSAAHPGDGVPALLSSDTVRPDAMHDTALPVSRNPQEALELNVTPGTDPLPIDPAKGNRFSDTGITPAP